MWTSHRNLKSLKCSKVNFDLPCTPSPCFPQLEKWPLYPPSCSSQKRDIITFLSPLQVVHHQALSIPPPNSVSSLPTSLHLQYLTESKTISHLLAYNHLLMDLSASPCSPVPLSTQQPECSCKIIRWSMSLLCLKPSNGFPLH